MKSLRVEEFINLMLKIMSKKEKKLAIRNSNFQIPKARVIKIDTSVSLLLTSMPPGNPGMPGYNPPDWGRPKW